MSQGTEIDPPCLLVNQLSVNVDLSRHRSDGLSDLPKLLLGLAHRGRLSFGGPAVRRASSGTRFAMHTFGTQMFA